MKESERQKAIAKKGYFKSDQAFTIDEFDFIKKNIDYKYTNVLKEKDIPKEDIEKHFEREFKLSHYHEISSFINHALTWPKPARILPENFVNWFLSTKYIKSLALEYGELEITDEEALGYPNIYWRITRPNQSRDVGPLHRDSWFWEIYKLNGKKFPDFERLKSWISINVEPGKNGLLVVNESHKNKELEWETIKKDCKIKPSLKTKISAEDLTLLKTSNNNVVTFDDDLVHGGSENLGKTTRVSIEFTVFLKDFKS